MIRVARKLTDVVEMVDDIIERHRLDVRNARFPAWVQHRIVARDADDAIAADESLNLLISKLAATGH